MARERFAPDVEILSSRVEELEKALRDMVREFSGREHKACDCNACLIVRSARAALTSHPETNRG